MCRQRCAEAKTKHGNKTRAIRAAYRDGMRKLDELKVQARKMGIIIGIRRRAENLMETKDKQYKWRLMKLLEKQGFNRTQIGTVKVYEYYLRYLENPRFSVNSPEKLISNDTGVQGNFALNYESFPVLKDLVKDFVNRVLAICDGDEKSIISDRGLNILAHRLICRIQSNAPTYDKSKPLFSDSTLVDLFEKDDVFGFLYESIDYYINVLSSFDHDSEFICTKCNKKTKFGFKTRGFFLICLECDRYYRFYHPIPTKKLRGHNGKNYGLRLQLTTDVFENPETQKGKATNAANAVENPVIDESEIFCSKCKEPMSIYRLGGSHISFFCDSLFGCFSLNFFHIESFETLVTRFKKK